VAELAHDANQKDLGTLTEALVEGTSKRDQTVMVGHSAKNQTVHFELPEGMQAEDLIGSMVDVRVDEARTWYLKGTCEGAPR
jgi:tRNA-2-methylthio-N6-dimethylallyladenosine synthase